MGTSRVYLLVLWWRFERHNACPLRNIVLWPFSLSASLSSVITRTLPHMILLVRHDEHQMCPCLHLYRCMLAIRKSLSCNSINTCQGETFNKSQWWREKWKRVNYYLDKFTYAISEDDSWSAYASTEKLYHDSIFPGKLSSSHYV